MLLDSSVAIALLANDHVHHEPARRWFHGLTEPFATCPITQGAVVRYALRGGRSAAGSLRSLESLTQYDQHEFWPDDIGFEQVRFDGVIGHRQVTDAYLAALARRHEGRLATLDRPMAELHSDVTVLVPTEGSR